MTFSIYGDGVRLSPEFLAKRAAADAAHETDWAKVGMRDLLLESYGEGFLSLEELGRKMQKVVRDFPEQVRHAWLGKVFDQALKMNPPEREGSGRLPTPPAIVDMAINMVCIVSALEGAPKSKESKTRKTAYKRVAEMLFDAGLTDVNDGKVRRWWEERDKSKPLIEFRTIRDVVDPENPN